MYVQSTNSNSKQNYHVISSSFQSFDGFSSGVLLGEHNTKTDPDCEDDFCADNAQYIKAASSIIPDGYETTHFAHDILLIKLAHRARFNGIIIHM